MAETEKVASERDELESILRAEFEGKFEVWKAKELATLAQKNDDTIKVMVKEYMDKAESERQPLKPEEIQKLLDQEYVDFKVLVRTRETNEERHFVIRELPQEVEKVFYQQLKHEVQNRASDIAALAQSTMDVPFEGKVEAFFKTFDGMFDILASTTVLVLNPDGADKVIDKEWCEKNMNSWRMWNIVRAQIEVNKLRNFFSELFESGARTQTMTTGLNTQSLQQLLQR